MISLLESMSFDETEWNKLVQEMHQAVPGPAIQWPDLDDCAQHLVAKADAQLSHFDRILAALDELDRHHMNPLAAMGGWKDAPGLTDRLPEVGMDVPKTEPVDLVPEYPMDTARPAPVSGFPVAPVAHRFGGWGA